MSVRPWSETIPEAKSVLAEAAYALVIEHIEAERDRYRKALEHADYELAAIADDAPEWVGDQIDNVRAGIKDATASALDEGRVG